MPALHRRSTFYIQKLYEAVTTIMIFIEKAASYPDRAIKNDQSGNCNSRWRRGISRATEPGKERQYIAALSAIVETGQKMLNAGESALDVVTEAVRCWKCPLFNAGIGSVLPAMKPMSWTPA
jgi:hypothetical protein